MREGCVLKIKGLLYKKIFVSILSVLIIVSGIPDMLTGLNLLSGKAYAKSGTMPVYFSESSSRNRSKTVTIPNLVRVTSVKVDTGNVSYSVNGNNVTISVSNGSSTGSSTSSMYISNYSKHTGSSEPPSTTWYSSGGYSGTLSLYSADNDGYYETKKTSRYFSKTVVNSRSWEINQWGTKFGSWKLADHGSSYEIDQDGYVGSIPQIGDVKYNPSDFSKYKIGDSGTQTATKKFGGNVTKTELIWHDDWTGYYRGYVYGSTTYYYSYNVTINYVSNVSPSINIITPSEGQVFCESDYSFIPVVSVSDPDGDTLICKLFLDGEASPKDTKTVSNTATAQNVSFNAQNIGLLTEGEHKMKFTVYDGEVTIQKEIGFTIDNTPPSIGTTTFDSSDTSISISGSATDNVAMHATPYCYSTGGNETQWMSDISHTFESLIPNTRYTAKFMARDKAGHIVEVSQEIYTKASKPVLSVGSASETSLVITLNDGNPVGTEYLVSCGSEYVTAQGTLSQLPEWIAFDEKSITVGGLEPNSHYTFIAKARSADGIETEIGNQAIGVTLAPPPQTLRFNDILQNSLIISWDALDGAIGYDIEVDNDVIDNGLAINYQHTGLLPETPHTYRVRVRNAGGVGSWSSPFDCMTLMNRPEVPGNVEYSATRTEISLSWNPVARADGYDIEADGVVQNTGEDCFYTHFGLEPDSIHQYRVRAKNAGGDGDWSPIIDVITLPNPPEPPISVDSEITKTEIRLIWEPVAKTDRYEVEVDGIIYDAGADTVYLHEGLTPLTRHQYRIRGINAGGTGEWSEHIYLTTHPYEPSVPENVMASSDSNSISLSWYMASYAYTYEVEIDGNEIEEVISTNFQHNGIATGSEHTYRIRAKNISGVSDWTSPITITASSQQADQNMSVTNLAAVVTYDSITLSWNSISDDCQYEVEADGVLINNGFDAIFNHAQLEPGSYHEYKIRVKSEEIAEWSSVLKLSTLPTPPGAPVITRSYASSTSIQIWWEPVENAVSYDVEADGEITTGITDITWLHEPLPNGTSHQYRVRARTLVDITPWSEVHEKSTVNTVYIIDCTEGETFNLSLLARNVQDFKDITFVVTYDSNQIEIADLFAGTRQNDLITDGQIPGTNIIVKHTPGRVELKVKGSIVPGTSWSGEITDIIFEAKETCTTQINFNEEE
jgi:hypothetical protein